MRKQARNARPRPTTTERGYGWDYQQARAELPLAPCARCPEPYTADDPPTTDHVVSVAHGGTHKDGLVWVHRSCNSRRGGRTRRTPPP